MRTLFNLSELTMQGDTHENQKNDFQTPPEICRYMVSLLPKEVKTVLEPTPGNGNIVTELKKTFEVTAPKDFFLLDPETRFDAVVMNPPFSQASANLENSPTGKGLTGMKVGYFILGECMRKSNIVIALMPWFVIIDSDVRQRQLKKYGIVSITALPRKTFEYTRIQTVVIHLQKGWKKETIFKIFNSK